MTTWTDFTVRASGYVVTEANWQSEIIDNMSTLNDFLGNTNGAHASFTDGGVLLGSGQGVFTAMGVLAKGSIIVGDGTTDPQAFAVGSDSAYLIADSAEALGVKWGTPATVLNPEDVMLYA